jgi:hypothetical protein
MSTIDSEGVRARYRETRCETAAAGLRKRGMDARVMDGRAAAVREVLSIIPAGSEVGCGGSMTVRELGLLEALRERGDTVFVHDPTMGFEETNEVRKRSLLCPYYLCSSNAITLKGDLVNVDGVGNRVCGMTFGPGTVVVVAGSNKLTADLDEAMARIRGVAAPANAIRYNLDLPCVKRGQCTDCHAELSICRVTLITSMRPMLTDLKVILVPEDLGF